MKPIEVLNDLAENHAGKLSGVTMALVLAGVSATVGLMWQLNYKVAGLVADQINTMRITTARTKTVNTQFDRIAKTNQNQTNRIDGLKDMVTDNKSAIAVLQNQVENLEKFGLAQRAAPTRLAKDQALNPP